jgi:hypothetical protein
MIRHKMTSACCKQVSLQMAIHTVYNIIIRILYIYAVAYIVSHVKEASNSIINGKLFSFELMEILLFYKAHGIVLRCTAIKAKESTQACLAIIRSLFPLQRGNSVYCSLAHCLATASASANRNKLKMFSPWIS